MVRNFKYRLYPTPKQRTLLNQTLTTCRYLYNSALNHRITEYKDNKHSVTYKEQANYLSGNKNDYQVNVHSQVLQSTLKRLDTSFTNFFRRIKEKKGKAGFPRFKGDNRYHSFCYPQSGFKLSNDGDRITLSKIGVVKLIYHRPVVGKIKTCTVIRDVDQWYVILCCESPDTPFVQSDKPAVGIDLGITTLASLSNGVEYTNPRHLKKAEQKLHQAQRILSKRVKGSENRYKQRVVVAKQHRRIRNQRDDFLHKLSRELVTTYGTIVFEDLKVKNMLKNHKLAKHISDCSWNKLVQYTTYKAESAGVTVVLVNPKNTSQMCSNCGQIVKKTLADRVHSCSCGVVLDRDYNASVNILKRGTVGTTGSYACGDNTSTLALLEQVISVKQETQPSLVVG